MVYGSREMEIRFRYENEFSGMQEFDQHVTPTIPLAETAVCAAAAEGMVV
jgi:hypothetical protein